MLKSTYRPPAGLAPLAEGWTQHNTPDGRLYYYNDATKQSTYSRPTCTSQQTAPSNFEPLGKNSHPTHEEFVTSHSDPSTLITSANGRLENYWSGQKDHHSERTDNRGFRSHQPRPQPKDRPKRKFSIPDCPPWLLVQTKLGRRFVHNSESGESFWKFPGEVMRAVIEFDRQERESRATEDKPEVRDLEVTAEAAGPAPIPTKTETAVETAVAEQKSANGAPLLGSENKLIDSDGEECEEVEVTDEEDDDHHSKRQKTDEGVIDQPVEFNEDDFAYQLAAMGEDYGLDPGEYGIGDEELEEGAEGLELTEEDTKALFKDMLSDFQISPYTTWDKIVEAGHIIEDDRYTVLSNMRSRKEVWDEWSRDTIQLLKEQRENEEKKDPRIPYFTFLQSHATPKLYWPEFRRKYRKEQEMHNTKLSDKDREKYYREYITRLKLPETTLKADLIKTLKQTPLHILNRSSTLSSLPTPILTDPRYISLRTAIRDPLIEAHISTLPPPLADIPSEETNPQAQTERHRRERALADRQTQVQEEKRRQRSTLQYSRGMLRDEEREVERAMKVGKEGLMGYE